MGNNQARSGGGSLAPPTNETSGYNGSQFNPAELPYDQPKQQKAKPLFITCRAHKQTSGSDIDIGIDALVYVNTISKDRLWAHVTVMKQSPRDINAPNLSSEGWLPWDCLEQMPEINDLNTAVWYHGAISRLQAQNLLDSGIHGSFLIRESESILGSWSISLRGEDTVYHYRINRVDTLFHISPSHRFRSLTELVEHHSEHADGLVTTLRFAVSKRQSFASRHNFEEALGDQWELDRNLIKIQSRLGGGQYGDVYRATFALDLNNPDHKIAVAVKTLRQDNAVSEDFKKEMTIMKKLKHPHLLKLIGVCSLEKPYYLVTEYMSQGCLLEFIRNVNPLTVNHLAQLRLVVQVCDAMRYLESKKFIHRDLAARNCLVTLDSNNRYLVKVADFGLSRLIEMNEIYTAKKGGKFPIKWTAPEAIAYNRFSVKSDIWSFGVLFWEVCSFGMQPYPGIEIAHVYEQLQTGRRLDCPDKCPRDCYSVIKQCWDWDEHKRPSFYQLHETLHNMLDRYSRESEPNFHQYQKPAPPNFSNHPSVRAGQNFDHQNQLNQMSPRLPNRTFSPQPTFQGHMPRPISTRPMMPNQNVRMIERPQTAMGNQGEFTNQNPFVRNEPQRKSGGILDRLKKSFGKGKNKKPKRLKEGIEPIKKIEIGHPTDVTSSISHSPMASLAGSEVDSFRSDHHPPDIWLSGKQPTHPEIAKPVPRKPPRRSRSKSGSVSIGSCSSPNAASIASGTNLPQRSINPLPVAQHRNVNSSFITSNSSNTEDHFNPNPPYHPPNPANTGNMFNLSNLIPTLPELTPTNSRENLCDFSSSTSQSDDFASLHSTGNQRVSKRPAKNPPKAPVPEEVLSSNTIGFSSLHGGRTTPSSVEQMTESNVDINTIINLQERLSHGLNVPGGVRRSLVLNCGQPLCDAATILLSTQPPYLPASKKFKFSEKLNSVQAELRKILINKSNDGQRLAMLTSDLVKLLK